MCTNLTAALVMLVLQICFYSVGIMLNLSMHKFKQLALKKYELLAAGYEPRTCKLRAKRTNHWTTITSKNISTVQYRKQRRTFCRFLSLTANLHRSQRVSQRETEMVRKSLQVNGVRNVNRWGKRENSPL